MEYIVEIYYGTEIIFRTVVDASHSGLAHCKGILQMTLAFGSKSYTSVRTMEVAKESPLQLSFVLSTESEEEHPIVVEGKAVQEKTYPDPCPYVGRGGGSRTVECTAESCGHTSCPNHELFKPDAAP